jgi:hypothetical protein
MPRPNGSHNTTERRWQRIASDQLLGRKIVEVRYLSHAEAQKLGWHSRPVVIQLDDGNIVFPSQDDEGNDGGALFTNHETNGTLPVLRS